MEALPIQIAYRGFDYGLTLEWVYERLDRSIKAGKVARPVHNVGPGGLGIPIHFSVSLIEYWKHQYDRHVKVDIPREIWAEIDGILGVDGQQV